MTIFSHFASKAIFDIIPYGFAHMGYSHNVGESQFPLGRTVATREALATLTADEIRLALRRHVSGDWGDLDAEDEARNDAALLTEGRLVSVYSSASGVRFYIITEADRSLTTILLTHEY